MMDRSALLLHINRQFKRFHALHPTHLIPPGELTLLLAIEEAADGARGATVSAVAQRLNSSPPAVSRCLRHLRQKGFVEDRTDPADRRTVRLTVSECGRDALRADMERMDCFMERVLLRLEPGELEQFSRILNRLCDSMACERERMQKEEPCERS